MMNKNKPCGLIFVSDQVLQIIIILSQVPDVNKLHRSVERLWCHEADIICPNIAIGHVPNINGSKHRSHDMMGIARPLFEVSILRHLIHFYVEVFSEQGLCEKEIPK